MRTETRRRLDKLVWTERARIALVVSVALAVLAALYVYANRPDPIVERRIVRGVVTSWMKTEKKIREAGIIVIWASLDDGRKIVFTQWLPDVVVSGPAEIEERRHKSGQLSFWWVKSKIEMSGQDHACRKSADRPASYAHAR